MLAAMGASRAVERDDGGPEIWLESIDGVARDGALSKPSRVPLTSLGQNSTARLPAGPFTPSCRPAFLPSASHCPWHGSTSLDAVLFLQAGADATCPWTHFSTDSRHYVRGCIVTHASDLHLHFESHS